ncbi:muscle M-line assembly protein unc-89-like isoform X1 [Herrania umbratica]|uniref:Muscle M-line assembly protein unc-89-like isoform X1 n=1 Tax=Herrania umbratica TaxID=108875 RepID=A0A6J1BD11_9ROSI|nr:muscle M-line assembly protein unc-89-like isoform X1 [Herrania umbratica]XP_021297039.1 muscle M-line assembly protein unc-89-like isoform X1 [Herrania umbratica]XP_021297040.1 muscle M-line assembly protein unc-89-like isoform X1 [Herrania umbratica]
MDGGIHGGAPLDYATIQILPSQNRYEAYTCHDNKVEKLAVGVLEKLLPHLPGVSHLYTKGLNANFKLQPPENLKSAAWFTKATLSRFLHIASSTDLVDSVKVIEGEMSQLEETRKFHLSLYAKGHEDHIESSETDICKSVDVVLASNQSKVQNSSSDTSKNELLRAMNSRLTALRSELIAAFNQAVGETCSYEEITHLAKFSENFGANDLKNFLCMFLELSPKSQAANPPDDEKSSCSRTSVNDNIIKSDGNYQISKPVCSETPVKYGVSPAKVAQVERQSSTESEESSDSSDENQTSAERSRALIRSASPRRSASPMRRVQIGRSGSRRAPALTIKSLSYFPAREKIFSHKDVASDDSEEEGSGQSKKPEGNVRRMSVQDAINLFESKQRDQVSDMPKKNSLTNNSLGASKSVLRRWSAGMGESSSQCQLQNASEDPVPEPPDNVIDNDTMGRSAGVDLESDSRSGGQIINETVDVNLERLEESSCSPIEVQEVTDKIQEDEANERSKSSAEWSRQKEVELNQMFKKMMENQPVSCRKPQTNVRQNLLPEQRGGFYDHYKVKRDQKLRGENSGKRAEKEAKFRAMQKVLDERKAEMASKNVNNFSKKDPPTKSQKSVKNSQKELKSPSQPANPRKEATKPSTVKKVSSRTSPLPATRKSWPSTPSPRTTGISPAKTSGGISSAGTTQAHRKPQSAQSVPRPSSKVESAQPERKNVKATQTDKRGLKSATEKQQQRLMKGSKTTKTKVATAPGDSSSMVPAKPSLYNKMTKKSSVVPLEAKPFLRKGSGFTSSVGLVNKIKNPSALEDSLKTTENSIDTQESDEIVNASVPVNEHQDQDISSLVHCDDDIQSETQVNGLQKSDVVESIDELAPDVDDGLKNIAESSKCEEELTISPAAWEEIEEHQDLPNQCDDNTGENTSSASIAPVGLASPRVRHSLSQMLQEESSEADTTEWGNAENPPAMIYQKDAPKGLKRLLKFARKSKGDANITGWSSPSVFSEGEDDAEESKAINKRNADNLLRKAALQAKNYGQQKMSCEGYENHLDARELPSAQSGISTFDAHKMHKGSVSTAASTTKGTRSFFSLSAFRGSKPSEMKLR